jgi:hypothetical protein
MGQRPRTDDAESSAVRLDVGLDDIFPPSEENELPEFRAARERIEQRLGIQRRTTEELNRRFEERMERQMNPGGRDR